MKTIKIDDKEIKISDESYNAFKEQFMTKKRWKPQSGEGYWKVDSYGDVVELTHNNDCYDKTGLSVESYYKTKEKAQKQVDKLKAIEDIKNYIDDNDMYFEPDWDDGKQLKYCIVHDNRCSLLSLYSLNVQYQSLIPCLKSKDDCKKIIKNKEKELLLIFDK